MVNLADHIALERPLAMLDLETTGKLADQDRVIQIGLTMYYPDKEPVAWRTFVDPEMPIPPEAQQKHKIGDADVTGAPTFRSFAAALAPKITDVDFAGYNLDFDLRFMNAEMRRAGVAWDWERNGSRVVDAKMIYFIKCPRSLEDAYREFVDPAGFQGAHDAGNDVEATASVLLGQLARFADLPRTVAALSDYCFPKNDEWVDRRGKIAWRGGEACINFGNKHNGKSLAHVARVDPGYFTNFMLRGDFPLDTKRIVEAALNGVFPRRP